MVTDTDGISGPFRITIAHVVCRRALILRKHPIPIFDQFTERPETVGITQPLRRTKQTALKDAQSVTPRTTLLVPTVSEIDQVPLTGKTFNP